MAAGEPEHSVPSLVGIVPGRSLMWSPAWDCSEGRILFDRQSGDFWLLQGAAIDVVQVLVDSGRLSWTDAVQAAGATGPALLSDLARSGVVRAWNNAGDTVPLADLANVD